MRIVVIEYAEGLHSSALQYAHIVEDMLPSPPFSSSCCTVEHLFLGSRWPKEATNFRGTLIVFVIYLSLHTYLASLSVQGKCIHMSCLLHVELGRELFPLRK